MLSKEFCRCYTVFYPPTLNVPFFHLHQQTLNIYVCTLYAPVYFYILLSLLFIYVRILYAPVYFYHYYFIICFTANGSVTKSFRKIVIVCKSLESWQKAAAVSSGVSFQVKRKAKSV